MVDWRHAAARAVEAELQHVRESAEWSVLGRLRDLGDDTHAVDLRGKRYNPIDDVRIAGEHGPREGAAVPASAELAGGVLWLRDQGPLPPDCDRVWVREAGRRESLERLLEGLRGLSELGDDAPAARLAAGEPDSVDTADTADGVAAARAACFAPGLRLVWGPPGTGKSRLISEVAAELAESGKRVLIAGSGDQPPVTAEAAERLPLQEELAVLAEADAELASLGESLADYDHDAFVAAARRVDNADASRALETEFAELTARHEQAADELAEARTELRAAREAWEEVAGERRMLDEAAVLDRRLTTVDSRITTLAERIGEGRGIYRGRRGDRRELATAEEERRQLREKIAELTDGANPLTHELVDELQQRLANAYDQLDAVARVESDAYTRLEHLRGKIAQLRSAAKARERDRAFHDECVHRGLPELHARREQLVRSAPRRCAQRGRLEERLWWLGERGYHERQVAERDAWSSARIVSTTLQRRVAGTTPFDVVLVDDAGSARLADVLLAVSQARSTAVIFGDLRQPGPRVRAQRLRELPEVRAWTLATAFSHCGIRTAADAVAHPGCAVLDTTYRSGGAARELAAATGYEGLTAHADAHTEVVLLDTAGEPFDRLALLRFLAFGGDPEGSRRVEVGVLAPTQTQAREWLSALRAGANAEPAGLGRADRLRIAVGTARMVPGHEFDTVLLDATGDDWADRVRSFGSTVTRARRVLYVLADVAALEAADDGTPLASVNALRRDEKLLVRDVREALLPRQRGDRPPSATDWHGTVTGSGDSSATIGGWPPKRT